ncbi:putative holin-like toxin [Alkalibacillus aidingensis]|nr:putative holin-like toxin [Alkalibacillus aidingensis]
METYGYILIAIAFGSFIVALLSLIVQIIQAINKKK